MSMLSTKFRKLLGSNKEQNLIKKGYWKGALSDRFQLWFNDNDECIIEERGKEYETGSNR